MRIIWIDDEIDLLKPHILFLEKKGHTISSCNNGNEGIAKIEDYKNRSMPFELVLLDENMPGISGLEVVKSIREVDDHIPVVMITKNEDEATMEKALGNQITDYIIKPVKPIQILSLLKKLSDQFSLVLDQTRSDYQADFRNILMNINQAGDFASWTAVYKDLVKWSLRLYQVDAENMIDILESQKKESNTLFSRFIQKNYQDWINSSKHPDIPTLSHNAFAQHVSPKLQPNSKTLLLMIDNLRYDQWKAIEPQINKLFQVESEELYCSILPTATQFARNAFFAGMTPLEIKENYPDKWVYDHEEKSKNQHEEFFLRAQLNRLGKSDLRFKFHKSISVVKDPKFFANANELKNYDFVALVYNFIDILSHSKTGMDVIKELITNDKDYLSITKNWLEDSPFFKFLEEVRDLGFKVIIASDHGTILVKKSIKVYGEKDSSTNLRYKYGKRLNCDTKVYDIRNAEDIQLPVYSKGYSYMFADSDKFFCYPNNYNYFSVLYQDSFQHGGISLEEMIVPIITLSPK